MDYSDPHPATAPDDATEATTTEAADAELDGTDADLDGDVSEETAGAGGDDSTRDHDVPPHL